MRRDRKKRQNQRIGRKILKFKEEEKGKRKRSML